MNEIATDIKPIRFGKLTLGREFWLNPFCKGEPNIVTFFAGVFTNKRDLFSIELTDGLTNKRHEITMQTRVYVRGGHEL